jgi:GNAT superfamily N-acetyltransferase
VPRPEIEIRLAGAEDVEGIAAVCAAGWRDTYAGIRDPDWIESVIADFYTAERIRGEIAPREGWDGWVVAVEAGTVVGAGGGGLTGRDVGELFVLYLDPGRRGEGIGTLLLDAITEQQREQGAREQWVSVAADNAKGLPFYLARGFDVRGERSEYGNGGGVSLRLMRPLDAR